MEPMTVSPREATGFEEDFSKQFNQRYAGLFQYLARLTGDGDLAADLAQEAFVRLYQRGEVPLDIGAWLVTVAHNRLRDQQRSVRRRLQLLVTGRDRVPAPATAPEPHADLVAADRAHRVRRVLECLPERERQLLLLHHSGHSYHEIAAVLGVAATGVGTLLRRAGLAFRQEYMEAYGTPD